MKKEIVIHEQGKIDIHNRKIKYQNALTKFKDDDSVISENKELILDFLRDCELGKTIKGKAKKKIGPARCLKYLSILKRISEEFCKPFSQVIQKDMENFILALENNNIRKKNKDNFSVETKIDYKHTIRKFWKWWKGDNLRYPEIVEWIDTSFNHKEIPALTKAEIELMVDQTGNLRNKALIMVLFDSGARIEELLNVRLKKEHIFWKEEIKCYLIRLEFSKTKPRTISIPLCTKYMNDWLKIHPAKHNENAQLFPVNYGNIKKIINRTGERVLNKRVYPHLLRHSSATYYANKINNPYKLCYRYGWSMASKMVNRYIDRSGINEIEVAETVKEDEINKVKKENSQMNEDYSRLKESYSELSKDMAFMKDKQAEMVKMFGAFLDKIADDKGIISENKREDLIRSLVSK